MLSYFNVCYFKIEARELPEQHRHFSLLERLLLSHELIWTLLTGMCTYVGMCVCTHVRMYAYLYACIYVCMYVCMCMRPVCYPVP